MATVQEPQDFTAFADRYWQVRGSGGPIGDEQLRPLLDEFGLPYWSGMEAALDEGVGRTKDFRTVVEESELADYLPFFAGAAQVDELLQIRSAANAVAEGTATQEQEDVVIRYMVDMATPGTWGGQVASLLVDMPAFMGEFAASGGVASLLKTGGKKVAGKLLRETIDQAAQKQAAGGVMKSLAKRGVNVGTHFGVQMGLGGVGGQRIMASTLQRTLGQAGMVLDENQAGELEVLMSSTLPQIEESLDIGITDYAIEVASEMSGGAIGKVVPIDKLTGMVLRGIQARAFAKGAQKYGVDKAMNFLAKSGWNGPMNEVLEEVAGNAMRAAAPNLEETADDIIPSWEEFTAMYVGFAVPGLAGGALGLGSDSMTSGPGKLPKGAARFETAEEAEQAGQRMGLVEPVASESADGFGLRRYADGPLVSEQEVSARVPARAPAPDADVDADAEPGTVDAEVVDTKAPPAEELSEEDEDFLLQPEYEDSDVLYQQLDAGAEGEYRRERAAVVFDEAERYASASGERAYVVTDPSNRALNYASRQEAIDLVQSGQGKVLAVLEPSREAEPARTILRDAQQVWGANATIVEPNLEREDVRAAQELAKRAGVRFVMVDPGEGAEDAPLGASARVGTIMVNARNKPPADEIAAHELVHELRRSNPELFDQLVDVLQRTAGERIEEARGSRDMSDEEAIARYAEPLAKLMRRMGTPQGRKLLRDIALEQPRLFDKIIDTVRRILAKIGLVQSPVMERKRLRMQEQLADLGERVTQEDVRAARLLHDSLTFIGKARLAGLLTGDEQGEVKLREAYLEEDPDRALRYRDDDMLGQSWAEDKERKLILADGTEIPFRYRVVNASDLLPSHDARRGFRQNPGGDKNERTYHIESQSKASRKNVRDIASDPQPERIFNTAPDPNTGPPIVTLDGVVLGGNARTMGLQLLYHNAWEKQENVDAAERVAQAAVQFAAREMGEEAEAVAIELEQPVIVRELQIATIPGALSRELNKDAAAPRTPSVDAVSRGSKVSEQAAQMIAQTIGEGTLGDVLNSRSKTASMLSALVKSGAFDEAEIESLMEGQSGLLTKAGRELVEKTIIGSLVTDVQRLSALPASARGKMIRSLPSLMRLSASWPQFKHHLAAMFDGLATMRGADTNLATEVDQTSLEDEPWKRDMVAVALLSEFMGRGPKSWNEFAKDLVTAVTEANMQQGAMFGEPVAADPVEALLKLVGDTPMGRRLAQASNFDPTVQMQEAEAAPEAAPEAEAEVDAPAAEEPAAEESVAAELPQVPARKRRYSPATEQMADALRQLALEPELVAGRSFGRLEDADIAFLARQAAAAVAEEWGTSEFVEFATELATKHSQIDFNTAIAFIHGVDALARSAGSQLPGFDVSGTIEAMLSSVAVGRERSELETAGLVGNYVRTTLQAEMESRLGGEQEADAEAREAPDLAWFDASRKSPAFSQLGELADEQDGVRKGDVVVVLDGTRMRIDRASTVNRDRDVMRYDSGEGRIEGTEGSFSPGSKRPVRRNMQQPVLVIPKRFVDNDAYLALSTGDKRPAVDTSSQEAYERSVDDAMNFIANNLLREPSKAHRKADRETLLNLRNELAGQQAAAPEAAKPAADASYEQIEREYLQSIRDALGVDEQQAAVLSYLMDSMGLDRSTIDFMRGSTPDPRLLNQRVWHGSSAAFSRFDTGFIGTGEGEQAYGWGLYFASRKSVAEWYRVQIAGRGKVDQPHLLLQQRTRSDEPGAVVYNYEELRFLGQRIQDAWREWFRAASQSETGPPSAMEQMDWLNRALKSMLADAEAELARQRAGGPNTSPVLLRAAERIAGRMRDVVNGTNDVGFEVTLAGHRGQLYEVELHPAESQYLLWEANASGRFYLGGGKQSRRVQTALQPIVELVFTSQGRRVPRYLSGEELYKELVSYFEQRPLPKGQSAQMAASLKLLESGVRGIKYVDGVSRKKVGPLHYNYVVFDAADTRMTRFFQQGNEVQGQVELAQDGRAIITGFESANFSTGVHEIAHVARRRLVNREVPASEREGITSQDILEAETWCGVEDGNWTEEAEERFARGFEKYLIDGKAPNAQLHAMFRVIAQWMRRLYEHVLTRTAGTPYEVKLTPEMTRVYDALVTRGQYTGPEQEGEVHGPVKEVDGVRPVRWVGGNVDVAYNRRYDIVHRTWNKDPQKRNTIIYVFDVDPSRNYSPADVYRIAYTSGMIPKGGGSTGAEEIQTPHGFYVRRQKTNRGLKNDWVLNPEFQEEDAATEAAAPDAEGLAGSEADPQPDGGQDLSRWFERRRKQQIDFLRPFIDAVVEDFIGTLPEKSRASARQALSGTTFSSDLAVGDRVVAAAAFRGYQYVDTYPDGPADAPALYRDGMVVADRNNYTATGMKLFAYIARQRTRELEEAIAGAPSFWREGAIEVAQPGYRVVGLVDQKTHELQQDGSWLEIDPDAESYTGLELPARPEGLPDWHPPLNEHDAFGDMTRPAEPEMIGPVMPEDERRALEAAQILIERERRKRRKLPPGEQSNLFGPGEPVDLDPPSDSGGDRGLQPPASFEGGPRPGPEDVEGVRRSFALGAQPRVKRANVSGDPNVRNYVRASDVQMGRKGEYMASIKQAEKDATRMLEEMGEEAFVENFLTRAREGVLHDQVEFLAARRISANLIRDALGMGGTDRHARAIEFMWAYRAARGQVARSLGMVRDVFPRTAREQLADVLAMPSQRVRRRFLNLEKKRRELREKERAQASEASRKRLRKELERIERQIDAELKRESERMQKALEKLQEDGLNPETVIESDLMDPNTRGRIAKAIAEARSNKWDWFLAYQYNAMLSFAGTHARNIAGNTLNTLQEQFVQRGVEAGIARALRLFAPGNFEAAPKFGEFKVMAQMLPEAFMQGALNGWLGYKNNVSATALYFQAMGIEVQDMSRIEQDIARQVGSGKLLYLDYLGTRLLQGMDDWAKTFVAIIEMHARSYREAVNMGLKNPKDIEKQMRIFMLDVQHPLHQEAWTAALKTAFQLPPGEFTTGLLNLRNKADSAWDVPMGTLMFPFVNTPTQIFQAGLRKIPPSKLIQMAVRAVRTVKAARADEGAEDVAKGRTVYTGAEGQRQLVEDLADLVIGVGVFWTVIALLAGDDDDPRPKITGSLKPWGSERELQYRAAPAMSVRFGDSYYSYAGLEPLATYAAPVVDAAERWLGAVNGGTKEQILAANTNVLNSIVGLVRDKTYLQGFGELVDLVQSGGKSQSLADFMSDTFFTRMVPNVIRGTARESDEYLRLSRTAEKSLLGRTLNVDKLLPVPPRVARYLGIDPAPPKRDIWGRPIPRGVQIDWSFGGLAGHLMKEAVGPKKMNPVMKADLAIMAWNSMVERGEAIDPRTGDVAEPLKFAGKRVGQNWSSEEVDFVMREGGGRAQRAIQGLVIRDVSNPTWYEMQAIRKILDKSYDAAMKQVRAQRRVRKAQELSTTR